MSTTSVGANLQVQASGSLNASAPSAMTITITSGDPTKVLLSNSPSAAGFASIPVAVGSGNGLNGVGFPTFYVQALQPAGSVVLTASVPSGWASGTITVNLTPSGFVLIGPNGTGQDFGTVCESTSCSSTSLMVQAMQLNPSTLAPQTAEAVAGGSTVNVPIGDSVPAFGTISGSPAVIAGGASSNLIVFQPVSTGTTQLSVTTPGGFSTPSTGSSLNVTVN
jgi:hypothetical protein